ncbi:MAG: arsenate reductase (glutaredoxin) [Cellvibrionales bacterium]|nr:arsenate reductase (glutaredoxin) [Cellvibrionales bacterium]
MHDLTLYHNPRCSKSRQTLALLQEAGTEPTVRLYLRQPPTATELRSILQKLGLKARQLLRKGEPPYKELNLANPDLTEQQLIAAMVAHPILIERPILISGSRAILGRPPENALQLLNPA